MPKITLNDHRPCPACSLDSARPKGEKYGCKMLACLNCDTWFVSPLPDSDSAQDYDEYYSPQNLVTPEFVSRRLDEIAATFASHRQSNRLLDVGFGAGDLLRAAVRSGWDAEGIEVAQSAVDHAKTLGLKVRQGEIVEANYPDNSFDVVTAVEVLEHVPDPQQVIGEVARILRPGGLFWATTPHGRGVSARLLKTEWTVVSPPEHLQLLSVKGAKALLTNGGFRSAQVATQGANPYEILHALRSIHKASSTPEHDQDAVCNETFNRNETGSQLNEFLISSPSRRAFKNAVNSLLAASHLGDSLKIRGIL